MSPVFYCLLCPPNISSDVLPTFRLTFCQPADFSVKSSSLGQVSLTNLWLHLCSHEPCFLSSSLSSIYFRWCHTISISWFFCQIIIGSPLNYKIPEVHKVEQRLSESFFSRPSVTNKFMAASLFAWALFLLSVQSQPADFSVKSSWEVHWILNPQK